MKTLFLHVMLLITAILGALIGGILGGAFVYVEVMKILNEERRRPANRYTTYTDYYRGRNQEKKSKKKEPRNNLISYKAEYVPKR